MQQSYMPDEDSVLLLSCLEQLIRSNASKKRIAVLELACGTGFISKGLLRNLSDKIALLVCNDIDRESVRLAREELRSSVRAEAVVADAATVFATKRFDLIAYNPPYLPIEEEDRKISPDTTIFGGKHGFEATLSFLCASLNMLKKSGRTLFVTSSLILPTLLAEAKTMCKNRVVFNVKCNKKLFFEELYVVEARPAT